MPSSISSSEPRPPASRAGRTPLRLVVATLLVSGRYLLAVVVLTVLLGELYMRLPFVAQRLEYEPDVVLGGRLAPNQVGYVWLAQMSLQSPPITLNRDGFRGRDTDWTQPVVLVLGDSEWFGAGVGDSEVWTDLLQQSLRADTTLSTLQVVNAAHPGHGPYHQLVVAQRVLATRSVDAILCRVAIGQRNFQPIPEEQRAAWLAEAQRRQLIRRATRFVPFLVNKLEAQMPGIRQAFRPAPLRRADARTTAIPEAVGQAMWQGARQRWEQLAAEAEARGIPILFVIQDLQRNPASDALEARLRPLATGFRTASVARIGPDSFGLGDVPTSLLSHAVRERLTLGRDPHANADQHRMLAEAIRRHLQDDGFSAQIVRRARARGAGTAIKAS